MRALQFVKGVNITTSQNNTLVENCFTSQYNVYEIYVTGVSLATCPCSWMFSFYICNRGIFSNFANKSVRFKYEVYR